jgi:hypothetical protein
VKRVARFVSAVCALATLACSGDDEGSASNLGGAPSSGGASSGGTSSGGTSSGGTSSGGTSSGGTSSGGTSSGGSGGIVADGGGGTVADAGSEVVLLEQLGVVFVPTESETMKKIFVGENGTVYQSVRVQLDLLAAGWQPEVPDEGNPDRTEHILFGLFRDHQTKTDQRYLMGSAAVTFATKGPHFRMFGRLSIGAGYTTYTQWSASYGWSEGTEYHLDCQLDGVSHVQKCELSIAGAPEKELSGDVAYLDPASHLNTGFYLELGRAPTGEIETSPIGWTYSNLRVTATQ